MVLSIPLHAYIPEFSSFDNLSALDLLPLYGPVFHLATPEHSAGAEVQITPSPDAHLARTITMGVFASVWPAWFFAARAAHIHVAWVVCLDNSSWDFFTAALDGTQVPLFRFTSVPSALDSVDIIGLNDVTTRGFIENLLVRAASCPLIISDKRFRGSLPRDMHGCTIPITHLQCGGVSDRRSSFQCFSQSLALVNKLGSFTFPDYPFAPLVSLLNRKLSGKPIPAWKINKFPSNPRVVNKVHASTAIHAHGLYPLSVKETPLVAAPCVYPSTPWTVRRLSTYELGVVFDLPFQYSRALGEPGVAALTHSIKTPLKPMMVLLQHLFYYAWPRGSPPLPLSVDREDDSMVPSVAVESDIESPSLTEVRSPAGITLDNVLGDTEVSVDSLELPSAPSSASGGTRDPSVVAGGGESSPLPQVENSSSVLNVVDVESTMVTEEQRKAVALKADKAPVPVHVWRQNLGRILDIDIPPLVYERGADVLRGRLLRIWKRGLFRHFILWAKQHHQELVAPYSWCTGQYNWDSFKFSPGVNTHSTQTVLWDADRKCYFWLRGDKRSGNVGLKRYQTGWKLRQRVLGKSRLAAQECIAKAAECSWWKWDAGSRLFFWRWPKEYMEEARDGARCWFEKDKLPRYRIPQRPPSNPEMIDKIREKLVDVVKKLYIAEGEVRSLTSFFDVMKGVDDIRMVYNGTSCGLNAACWAPWFPLPTIKTHLRAVEAETWLADIDLGEMFLNFMLDERLQAYAGVDLTMYLEDRLKEGKDTVWMRWVRLLMGFTASPYLATRCLLRSRRILLGDRLDESNPFRWDHVVKNYPGLPSYNPLRPMVYKARIDGSIAADLMKYIDDLRLTALDAKEIWEASMQIMTRVNWLGMQNAARKYRDGALLQGAWSGAIVHTLREVTASISQGRWDKCKAIIDGMIYVVEKEHGVFGLKKLLSDRGFLTYVSQTYPAMVPYLKGIHLTVDSWRPNRDEDGWKINIDRKINDVLRESDRSDTSVDAEIQEIEDVVKDDFAKDAKIKESLGIPEKPPDTVKAATRIPDDLYALRDFFKGDTPVKRRVRAKSAEDVRFGFGDASGDGYGSGTGKLIGTPKVRHGKWGLYYSTEDISSNFRELRNLVDGIELDYREGLLDGVELFFFTDNQVAERAYYKGTSSSRTLFNLILRLRKIEMEGRMIIHVIHISGKRMIACGVDGLSRGDTSEGIGAGESMENFVPLHLDAAERSPRIVDWVHRWWPTELGSLTHLTMDDWFIWDESMEGCLWTPAPAGGEAAVEEFANWIHHTEDRIHIMLIPSLWTCTWRKQLKRASDTMLTVPNLFDFWNSNEHFEPLTLAIFIPYLNRPPWRIKHHEIVAELERKLRTVQSDPEGSHCGSILRKFLLKARKLRRLL